jgi:DNA-directed RNA polymerase specialized sigma24 family protein
MSWRYREHLPEEVKRKISRSLGGPSSAEVDVMVAAYERGFNLREVAAMVGIGHMCARRHLLRRGVRMRKKGTRSRVGPSGEARS